MSIRGMGPPGHQTPPPLLPCKASGGWVPLVTRPLPPSLRVKHQGDGPPWSRAPPSLRVKHQGDGSPWSPDPPPLPPCKASGGWAPLVTSSDVARPSMSETETETETCPSETESETETYLAETETKPSETETCRIRDRDRDPRPCTKYD